MLKKQIKIGLVGFGRLGAIHAKNINDSANAVLHAVCDINPDALKQANDEYGVQIFDNLDEFLELPLDGVVVSTSTSEHLENIRKIASKGVAIFSEKPIGLTLEATDKILGILAHSKIPFQIGFQRRWDPRYKELKRIIHSGKIGRPVLMKSYGRDSNGSSPAKWGLDKNGGLFLNAAIHDYDLARFIFEKEVSKLTASGAAIVYKDLEKVHDIDTCSTSLFLEDGCMAITEWSRYATYGYDIELEVICTEGRVRIGRDHTRKLEILSTDYDAPNVFEIFEDAFKAEIGGFIEAIVQNTPMSPSVEDARTALQLALLARSSFQNNSVMINVPTLKSLNS